MQDLMRQLVGAMALSILILPNKEENSLEALEENFSLEISRRNALAVLDQYEKI